MKLQYLRAFIVLLAGLVALISNIKAHTDVTISLLIVLIVIIVFYIIGTLIIEIFQKTSEPKVDDNLTIIVGDEEQQTEAVHVSFDDEEDTE